MYNLGDSAMTMHLARGLSTTRTTKPKHKKLTPAQLEKLEVERRQHNKQMRRRCLHSLQFDTLDDYVAYIRGEHQSKPQSSNKTYDWEPKKYQRETCRYESHTSDVIPTGVCAKPERKEYTGTLIKGIATMHKSNAVPVISKEDAVDCATMRRN